MVLSLLASKLAMRADISVLILTFFSYSLIGYVMECIVLSAEKKHVVVNRGFTSHLPFCIIYGTGAMIGFILLSPFNDNPVLLYLVGAVAATGFEYAVGRTQLKLFGSFWWDYTEKPFNFQGMICLESTIFWGFVALVVVRHLHVTLVGLISQIPATVAVPAAAMLFGAYVLDFAYSAYRARCQKLLEIQQQQAAEYEQYRTEHS